MGLMDEIKQEQDARKVSRCGVAVVMAQLSPDDAADLSEAMAGDFTAIAISNALAKQGFTVNYQVVQRHRKGACGCAR